jgi:hypothetical protein
MTTRRGGGDVIRPLAGIALPGDNELLLGYIIGIVDVVNCIVGYQSPWSDDGAYHWVLANPRALSTPLRYRGRQGLFEVALQY